MSEKSTVIGSTSEDNKIIQNRLENYIESRQNANQMNELFGEPQIPPKLLYQDIDSKPEDDFENKDGHLILNSSEKNNASIVSSKSLSSPHEQGIFVSNPKYLLIW